MSTRTQCGNCTGRDLMPILDLGSTPLADNFPSNPTASEETFPLQLLMCPCCSLVQLSEIVPDQLLWSNYGFYTGTSPGLVKYLDSFATIVRERYGEPFTLEIACNDGTLLSRLSGKRIGIDAAEGPVAAARAKGLDVRHGLFGLETAARLLKEVGPVDLIVAQNVMAHVSDLRDFLSGIRMLLAPNGRVIIEFQSLADLVAGNQFDHIYHEHRFFFSALSARIALVSNGLYPLKFEKTPMQGGSIRVTCSKKYYDLVNGPDESGITEQGALLEGLQQRAEYLRSKLLGLIEEESSKGIVAGWAASAKSNTLLNWCGITTEHIPYIIDTTPEKIGKYTPGTHIPIVGPGDKPDPDTFLLLAHNYINRIRTDPFKGRWLVPIPFPMVI